MQKDHPCKGCKADTDRIGRVDCPALKREIPIELCNRMYCSSKGRFQVYVQELTTKESIEREMAR